MALLLAGIGLYGLMSYSVSQRKRELALRMAVGADGATLIRQVAGEGLKLAMAGLAAGLALALLLTRLLGVLLYRVSPRDPQAFGFALAVLLAAALAASFGPAWRAMRTDPAQILRA